MNALVKLLAELADAGVQLRANRPFLLHRPATLPPGLGARLDRHREALLVLLAEVQAGQQAVGGRGWLIAVASLLSVGDERTDTIREAAKPRGGGLWA
jgi:hypothetical protein